MGDPPKITVGTRGTLAIWQPSRGVLFTQVTGCFEDAFAASFISAFTSVVRNKTSQHAFHDWSAMVAYDVDARIALTRWSHAHRHTFASVHFLVSSTLVRLGVQVANVALGGFMTVHEARTSFEHALVRETGLTLAEIRGTGR